MSKIKDDSLTAFGAEDVREPASAAAKPPLVELSMDFACAVRARSNPSKGLPADKEFIDSLYEDEAGDGNFALTDIDTA